MRTLAYAVITLAAGFLVGALAIRLIHYGFFGNAIMDDAFFFVRYAANFLETGVFSWNRGESPVHGNTSQLYQLMVTLAYWLLDRNAILAVTVPAALGAIAYLVAVPHAYLRSTRQTDSTVRLLVCAFAVGLIAFDGQLFLLTGVAMETTWAMALVALSLAVTFRAQAGDRGMEVVLLNAVTIALVYAVRPDATLLAIAAPAGLVLFDRDRDSRRAGIAIVAAALAMVALIMLVCWAYYGNALPEAFTAKTDALTTLPPDGRDEMIGYPFTLFLFVLIFHVPETVLAVVAFAMFFRLPPALRGAALGMLAFIAYHLLLVLPIMGYFGRFYAPMLPVLTLMALHAVEVLVARSGVAHGIRSVTIVGAALLVGVALLAAQKTAPTAKRVYISHAPALQSDPRINTKAGAIAHVADGFSFFRGRMVRMVEALTPDCSIASTEDGLLSAYAVANRVVDLSGLHDRRLAREGFSAERVLTEQKPDVLVMPHPFYGDWTRALQSHPLLARDYEFEPAFVDTGTSIGFRRDSVCAARVRKAVYGK